MNWNVMVSLLKKTKEEEEEEEEEEQWRGTSSFHVIVDPIS